MSTSSIAANDCTLSISAAPHRPFGPIPEIASSTIWRCRA
jgi:hypothetical protein